MRARDIVTGILKGYQRLVSPYLGDCCRFSPSCSEYAIRSILLNGALLGLLDGVGRVVRCNPFHPGGHEEPVRINIFGMRCRWKKG